MADGSKVLTAIGHVPVVASYVILGLAIYGDVRREENAKAASRCRTE